MANLDRRYGKDGQLSKVYVRWRTGGARDGEQQSEPFTGPDAETRAGDFARDVERHDHQWPPLYYPRVGYVSREQYARLAAPTAPIEPTSAAHPLLPYLRNRISLLSGVTAGTRSEYYRLIANYCDAYEPFRSADVADPDTLNQDTVSAWVNWLKDGEVHPEITGAWVRAPKASKTIHNAHGLLFQLLDYATRGEKPLRRTNPCAHTDLPRLDSGTTAVEMVVLTQDEYELLYRCGSEIAQDISHLAVATGARFGEYTAFFVGDVNRDGRPPTVSVQRAWKRDASVKTGDKPGFVLGEPKSAAGRRTVAFDEGTLGMLEKNYLDRRRPSEYLLTDTQGRPWTHARFYRAHWQPMVYRAIRCEEHRAFDRDEGRIIKGKRVRMTSKRELAAVWFEPCFCPGTLRKVPRIHDHRHIWVSWLIAAGVPITKIAKAAGHDDIKTTYKVYGHLLPELDDAVAEAIGASLSGLRRGA